MSDSSEGFCICSSPSSNVLILVGQFLNVGEKNPYIKIYKIKHTKKGKINTKIRRVFPSILKRREMGWERSRREVHISGNVFILRWVVAT